MSNLAHVYYARPVPYSVDKEQPDLSFKEFRYMGLYIPTQEAFRNKIVWCRSREEFYRLLNYWNSRGAYYKYWEDPITAID